jgi:streptogramin lyase
MIVLDPATGQSTTVPIPHPNANPRAVEIDAAGRWWVALGGPRRVARYDPARGPAGWRVWNAGMYAHSVALAPDGRAWVNGHFTRSPELIAAVDTSGDSVRTVALPSHPTLAQADGGPIPYEIRVAPDGVVWTSELQGNRLVGHDPRTGTSTVIEMPRPHMAPRRFDIDARGILWVPSYSGNAIVRIDPRALGASRTREYALPIADALPYVVRVHPRTGLLWIGTAAADAVLTLDPRTGAFTTYRVPSRGALVRHMAIDSRTGDVWLAYGASPGPLSSRVARVRIAP